MPVTQIILLQGYDREVQQRLVDHVSKAVRSVIPAPEAGTTTFIQEVVAYRRDGRFFDQGNAALQSASKVVKNFLAAMQARDLAQAQSHLHADFQMVFPGGQTFHRLEELVAWAKTRYQRVEKTIERVDESWQGDRTVVFCAGRLNGVWPNGTPFDNIRFIDRFEVAAGQLMRQDVWNDLGEHRHA
jgi:phenylpyruvate tautomerase PptA (4-oxalocrotonate tautomerase family)/limonene-1,2-epoxide hydrolase